MEQKKIMHRKRSSLMDQYSIELTDDLECAIKTGHWPAQNNMTLELEGGDPTILDNPKFITDSKLKSAANERRVPNKMYDHNIRSPEQTHESNAFKAYKDSQYKSG